jgi:Protein of unknown function (DUF2848)
MKFTHSGNEIEVNIDHLYVAGWTGRNQDAVNHHIDELAAIGIAPPSQVPLYYRVSNGLLTQDQNVDVLGEATSGEIEPLLIQKDGEIWIGLASDHTDRELEAHSVAASKQACPKPAASELWKYDTVKDHIDDLIMVCSIKENGKWVTYQEGALSNIRPLAELMAASGFGENAAMLCGTLSALGGVRPASDYKMELIDPVLNTKIQMEYSVTHLPIVS